MFENGVTYLYVGNVTNGATDDTTTFTDIAAGSVALVKFDGSASHGLVQESNMTGSAATVPLKSCKKPRLVNF